MTTVAPGMTPPVASFTLPTIVPVSTWAGIVVGTRQIATTSRKARSLDLIDFSLYEWQDSVGSVTQEPVFRFPFPRLILLLRARDSRLLISRNVRVCRCAQPKARADGWVGQQRLPPGDSGMVNVRGRFRVRFLLSRSIPSCAAACLTRRLTSLLTPAPPVAMRVMVAAVIFPSRATSR